jgi:hypothetical protein
MGKDCDHGQRLGDRRQHAERLQVALRPRRRIQGKLLLSDFPAEQTTCRRQAAHLGNHAAIVRTWKKFAYTDLNPGERERPPHPPFAIGCLKNTTPQDHSRHPAS